MIGSNERLVRLSSDAGGLTLAHELTHALLPDHNQHSLDRRNLMYRQETDAHIFDALLTYQQVKAMRRSPYAVRR